MPPLSSSSPRRSRTSSGGMGRFASPRYAHKDAEGRCSFEALVEEHCAGDEALRRLARIVRSADFADQLQLTPEGAGLRAISQGFPLAAANDDETLDRASFVYDALYAF